MITLLEKKRRVRAANYLIESNNKYIWRYPEKDLIQILKNSGYHSEEWEETDAEETATKKTSLYIYKKWWRSPAVWYLLFIICLLVFTLSDTNTKYKY